MAARAASGMTACTEPRRAGVADGHDGEGQKGMPKEDTA
jgi:hypothetical protein